MSYIWWLLGYEEDFSPSEEDIKNRHEMMTQVKKSKLILKCVEVIDKTKTLLNEKDCVALLHKEKEEKEKKCCKEEKESVCHCECETCNCVCDFDCDNSTCPCCVNDTTPEKKEININEKKRKIEERLKKRKLKS